MAGKASTEQAWAEAARRCRLSAADVRMARELGFQLQGLLKSIPPATQRWKAPSLSGSASYTLGASDESSAGDTPGSVGPIAWLYAPPKPDLQ